MKRADVGGTRWAWVALVALALCFVVVSQRLFAERYAKGDIYPAYSSFGSDAKGTRALYRGLAALETVEVERSVDPLAQKVDSDSFAGTSTAVLLTGWTGRGGPRTVAALDELARGGARVVVAVAPEAWVENEDEEAGEEGRESVEPDATRDTSEDTSDDAGEEDPESGTNDDEGERLSEIALELFSAVNAFGRWGADLRGSESEGPWPAERVRPTAEGRPQVLHWPTGLHFETASDAWEVLYATHDGPVVIERRLGNGSLVLASTNQFLINETMAQARQTGFVIELLEGAERVVFEETHLGIEASPGVVALARRYRLHGVAVALFLVMALAVWRGASSLMPAMERLAPSAVEARSGREGMVSLLRRGVSERELLAVCLDEWSAGRKQDVSKDDSSGQSARQVARGSDPVEGYRRLSRLLQRKTRSG